MLSRRDGAERKEPWPLTGPTTAATTNLSCLGPAVRSYKRSVRRVSKEHNTTTAGQKAGAEDWVNTRLRIGILVV
jgi:hypothetical protein